MPFAWFIPTCGRKPAFFNDVFKRSVDDDMIPVASLRRLNGVQSARRRSSLGEQLGFGSGAPGPAQVAPVGGGEGQGV